jgi:hypothetical protein
MRYQDSTKKVTEKDAKPQIVLRTAAPEGETASQAAKELTDEQTAAVTGGSGGWNIQSNPKT